MLWSEWNQIEQECIDVCNRLLAVVEDHMLPNTISMNARISLLKMKADYHRYLSELLPEAQKDESAEKSLIAYKLAQVFAEEFLWVDAYFTHYQVTSLSCAEHGLRIRLGASLLTCQMNCV